jgi:hypothetical protein
MSLRVDLVRSRLLVICVEGGVQNVGMIIVFAPWAISSLNASGKARSQQISKPTFPKGVVKTSWGSVVEEWRCSRSGIQRFFLR